MIEEAYVSFEVARLLKEKGFDIPLNYFYNSDGRMGYATSYNWNQTTGDFPDYSCPTHQMAMAWLREVHHIFIYIEPFITTSGLQGYKPYCTKIGGEFMWINPLRKFSNTSSDTYEEAVEAALKYALENLIKEARNDRQRQNN